MNALLFITLLIGVSDGFQVPTSPARATGRVRTMEVTMVAPEAAAAPPAALKAERYIASNRFRVKAGREAAFEKRWADRKSRLGLLDGFRFFCMLRRVEVDAKAYEDDVNYVSFTVWEQREFYDAWRKGEAFKEAHGGGTIGGVASMLVATAMNTKGKPKPAMWEGTLPVVGTVDPTAAADGWRAVQADGVNMLPTECFVAMNRFSVADGMETMFEQRFASRDSSLTDYDGFKAFLFLRRDGPCDDGFGYSTWSVWRDQAAFEAWRDSEKRAGTPKLSAAGPPSGPPKGPPAGKRPEMFVRPPVPSFYQGILALESELGA